MNELVQILKNTRQHLMTGVSHDSLRGIGRYFAGGFRHVVWQRRSAGCRSRSKSEKLFDIGVAGLTLMVPSSQRTSVIPLQSVLRWLRALSVPGLVTALVRASLVH